MSVCELFNLFVCLVLMGIFCLVTVGICLLYRIRKQPVKAHNGLKKFVFFVTIFHLILFTVTVLLCVYKFTAFDSGIWLVRVGIFLVVGEIGVFGWCIYRDAGGHVSMKKQLLEVAGNEKTEKKQESTEERISRQLLELFEKQHIYREFELRIEDVAMRIGTNRTYLSSVLNNKYGYSFLRFVNRYRLDEAKELLLSTSLPVCRIADKVGYKNINTFISCFRDRFGLSPKQWRLNHVDNKGCDL